MAARSLWLAIPVFSIVSLLFTSSMQRIVCSLIGRLPFRLYYDDEREPGSTRRPAFFHGRNHRNSLILFFGGAVRPCATPLKPAATAAESRTRCRGAGFG